MDETDVNDEGVLEHKGCRRCPVSGKYYNEAGDEVIPKEFLNTEKDVLFLDMWAEKKPIPSGVSKTIWRRKKWVEAETKRLNEIKDAMKGNERLFAVEDDGVFIMNALATPTVRSGESILRHHDDQDDQLCLKASQTT